MKRSRSPGPGEYELALLEARTVNVVSSGTVLNKLLQNSVCCLEFHADQALDVVCALALEEVRGARLLRGSWEKTLDAAHHSLVSTGKFLQALGRSLDEETGVCPFVPDSPPAPATPPTPAMASASFTAAEIAVLVASTTVLLKGVSGYLGGFPPMPQLRELYQRPMWSEGLISPHTAVPEVGVVVDGTLAIANLVRSLEEWNARKHDAFAITFEAGRANMPKILREWTEIVPPDSYLEISEDPTWWAGFNVARDQPTVLLANIHTCPGQPNDVPAVLRIQFRGVEITYIVEIAKTHGEPIPPDGPVRRRYEPPYGPDDLQPCARVNVSRLDLGTVQLWFQTGPWGVAIAE